MNREIEVCLDHLHEDMTATVEFDISFHSDSHGAPYGQEEWVEYEINRQVIYIAQDAVPMPADLEKEIRKEIEKEILATDKHQFREIA